MWHDCADQYGYEDSSEDEEQAYVIHHWKSSVCEENGRATNPRDYQIPDEDVPPFWCVIWTVESVHGHCNLTADACHCGYSVSASFYCMGMISAHL
jgi:hypothetical protein